MTNLYFNDDGTPAVLSRGLSSVQRNTSALVEAGFDKLPTPAAVGMSTGNYAVDTGTVNNLVCTLNAQVVAHTDGMEIVIKPQFANTGAVTILAGSLTIKDVVAQDGTALTANAYAANQIIALRYNATAGNYQYLVSDGASAVNAAAAAASAAAASSSASSAASSAAIAAAHVLYISREARTSNTIIGLADAGKMIEITSGTFTQTFTAAATLGNGFALFISNSGTGRITIPSSDGLTNWIMYPKETRLFYSDGTNFYSKVMTPFLVEFTATEVFTKPPGYGGFHIEIWGAGGGGGSGYCTSISTDKSGGGGGGGGGYYSRTFSHSELSATVTTTIGAGGAGGAATTSIGTSNIGVAGGTTTFGTLMSATGGGAGSAGSPTTAASSTAGTGGGSSTSSPEGTFTAGVGGSSNASSSVGGNGSGKPNAGSGGGGGSQETAADVLGTSGGIGGIRGTTVTGGGAAGVSSAGAPTAGGNGVAFAGGGGGGSAQSVAGAAGGAGGTASGGGGGGSGRGTTGAGAGGAGGNGFAVLRGV